MPHGDATTLFTQWRDGDRAALDDLFPLVYEHLRERAHRSLRGEADGHTLTTTALVHETYLRLLDIKRVRVQDRAHFLALAATAMRRVLIDYARRRRSAKRGGGMGVDDLDSDVLHIEVTASLSTERADDMLALDEALEKLTAFDGRLGRTVEMRFFGGLTIEETAEALDLAPSAVKLDWQKAKSWLYQELARQ